MSGQAYKNLLGRANLPSNWDDSELYEELKDRTISSCRFHFTVKQENICKSKDIARVLLGTPATSINLDYDIKTQPLEEYISGIT